MTLSIPTAITGQYGNAPKDIASVLPSDVSERFSLQLEITKAEEIIGIKSETHEITWDRLPYKPRVSTWEELSAHYCGPDVTNALVKLKSEANYSRKDFVLTIETRHLRSADNPHVCVESHPYLENQKALKITIPSSVAIDMARISDVGEVIFAVDRSGSMHDKIDTVRDSLRLFLDGIPIGRTFNIWSFGSSTEMLWEKSQPYDQERLQVALDYVEQRIQADMGGTELSSTLRGLLPFRDAHYPSDVIILTDGEAWQLEQTLAFIRNARDTSHGNLRFFSLGIGAHVSHALLRGIASLGGGYSEVLPMASLGGWKTRVFTTLKAALTCHDIDFKIEINGDDSLHRYLRSPIGPENFNLFQENRIYLLSKPDCPTDQVSSITLKILKAPGDRILTTISPIILEKTDTTIHTLAAGAILHDLEYHKIRAAWDEMREITQSQAKDFACRFSIVSKWTSLYLQQESLDLDSQEQVSCFLIRTSNDVGDIDLFRQRGAMPVDKEYRCSTHPTPISRSLRILSSILTLGHRPGEQEPVYTATGADLLTGRAYDFPDIGAVGYSVNLDACMGVYRIPKLGSNNHPQVPASNYRSVLVSPQYDCPPTPKRPRRTLRKRFITNLLAYQNFDGSIGVDVCSIRDPLFAKAAKGIEQYVLRNCHTVSSPANLVACTVVGVALLERDFRNDEALWTTMRTKAMKYVETQLSDKPKAFELLNLAKLWLSGEQPPLSNIGSDANSRSLRWTRRFQETYVPGRVIMDELWLWTFNL
ncbi:von Willebrand factor type A domain-containing protein [Hypomontagnella monticulosa]|nr:von Willebrand factor type A domain-containing protein [Hypomontagnella monticulosa]